MPNLLHIDSSIRTAGSTSRTLSAGFAQAWREVNPEGGYEYQDFARDPVPHLTFDARESLLHPDLTFPTMTDEEREYNETVHASVHRADVILLGCPMYNYSVPSSVKAWIDRLVLPSYLVEFVADTAPLRNKRVVVATARGNIYSTKPETDLQEPYLRALFGAMGVQDIQFAHAELTAAREQPFLTEYIPLADASMKIAQAQLDAWARS